MKPQRVSRESRPRLHAQWFGWSAAVIALVMTGCKSDLNQQLLERELRYQEDQIYQLQDELAEQCARLEHVAGENSSLRKQLGVSAGDAATPGRGRQPRMPGVPPATPVPPAIEIPDAGPRLPRGGPAPRGGGPPVDLAPPTLEGVPPLPAEPGRSGPPFDTGSGLSLPPAAAIIDPAARPIDSADDNTLHAAAAEAPAPTLVRLSYDEPADGGEAIRLAINPSASSGIDANGDGQSEGLALAIEPRNKGERLVGLTGDLTITAYDAAAASGGPPLARWTVAAADAAARFRPTGRRRGLVIDLPWQGTLPAARHVRVTVQSPSATGPLTAEALVPVR